MLDQRNQIIMLMQKLPLSEHVLLLGSNSFQAGLDALDPDCPCYVRDNGIRECVFLGLKYRIYMPDEEGENQGMEPGDAHYHTR